MHDNKLTSCVGHGKVAEIIFHVIREGWKLCPDLVHPQPRVGLDVAFVVRFRDLQYLWRHFGDHGAMKPSSYVCVVLTRDQKSDPTWVGRFTLAYHVGQYVYHLASFRPFTLIQTVNDDVKFGNGEAKVFEELLRLIERSERWLSARTTPCVAGR